MTTLISSRPIGLHIILLFEGIFTFYILTARRVPTGQGKLEKVREFEWSGKVRESQGKCLKCDKVREKSGKMKIMIKKFYLECLNDDF